MAQSVPAECNRGEPEGELALAARDRSLSVANMSVCPGDRRAASKAVEIGIDELAPRIPASAGALVRDRKGRLLILKPTYKSGWTIPGGIVEADGETPWEACQRETWEECALRLRRGTLVCVDFLRPRPGRPGGMRFLFECDTFDKPTLAGIVLQPEEISKYRLARLDRALPLLSGPVRRRVAAALSKPGRLHYLEDGRRVR